jgi:hypothetical protein
MPRPRCCARPLTALSRSSVGGASAFKSNHPNTLPWKRAADEQRLNPSSGLPLVATLDRLFDADLIGFTRTRAAPNPHQALVLIDRGTSNRCAFEHESRWCIESTWEQASYLGWSGSAPVVPEEVLQALEKSAPLLMSEGASPTSSALR